MAHVLALIISGAFLAVAEWWPHLSANVLWWFAVTQLAISLLMLGVKLGESR